MINVRCYTRFTSNVTTQAYKNDGIFQIPQGLLRRISYSIPLTRLIILTTMCREEYKALQLFCLISHYHVDIECVIKCWISRGVYIPFFFSPMRSWSSSFLCTSSIENFLPRFTTLTCFNHVASENITTHGWQLLSLIFSFIRNLVENWICRLRETAKFS